MPLYEYECESCSHRFEVIQKFSDAPISVCPKCGGPVQKLLSSPAIQFKGSGFYLTDYGRGTGSKSETETAFGGQFFRDVFKHTQQINDLLDLLGFQSMFVKRGEITKGVIGAQEKRPPGKQHDLGSQTHT